MVKYIFKGLILMFNRIDCKSKKETCESGNVIIVVAFSMAALLTLFSFIIDTGYLYGAKNTYQNGVESAAMAGAVSLCDDDPEAVARQVAMENGLPGGSIVVRAGFYDERNVYRDFPGYRDFVAEGEGGYPEEEYNNAVMVRLNAKKETMMGGFLGKDEVTVGAAAVAYLVPYGLFAGVDIVTQNWWEAGYPRFEDMGIIHSNNNIDFNGGSVTLTGNTRADASGEVFNCPEDSICDSATDTISIRPIDWEALELQADENGQVITPDDFPSPGSPANCQDDENHNHLCQRSSPGSYIFRLADGDHEGRTYYFRGFSPDDSLQLGGMRYGQHEAWNLTIASVELPINFRGNHHIYLGGENERVVYIYCKENAGIPDSTLTGMFFEGVVVRTEKDICWHDTTTHTPSSTEIRKVRGIADGNITIRGGNGPPPNASSVIYNGKFGPPCMPARLFLGVLENL